MRSLWSAMRPALCRNFQIGRLTPLRVVHAVSHRKKLELNRMLPAFQLRCPMMSAKAICRTAKHLDQRLTNSYTSFVLARI